MSDLQAEWTRFRRIVMPEIEAREMRNYVKQFRYYQKAKEEDLPSGYCEVVMVGLLENMLKIAAHYPGLTEKINAEFGEAVK